MDFLCPLLPAASDLGLGVLAAGPLMPVSVESNRQSQFTIEPTHTHTHTHTPQPDSSSVFQAGALTSEEKRHERSGFTASWQANLPNPHTLSLQGRGSSSSSCASCCDLAGVCGKKSKMSNEECNCSEKL